MLINYKKKYDAKLEGYGIQKTKAGDPQPYIQFSIMDENGDQQKVYWHGSLKGEKAEEITLTTLVKAGFSGSDIADLNKNGMFMAKDLNLVLEEHVFNGKTTVRVKFVNSKLARTQFEGQLPKLGGKLAATRALLGVKNSPKATEPDPF
jgi:hypothetical protein